MMTTEPQVRKLRVLLVPDFLPWITGTIAREIAANNPWIEPTICTGATLGRLGHRFGKLPLQIDVIHYLSEYEPGRCATALPEHVARVNTVHHVEDWNLVRPLLTSCDALHVVSQYWERQLQSAGMPPNRTVLVSNGVNTTRFRPPTVTERAESRRRFGVPNDRVAVGMFAKRSSDSSNRKGIDVFAAALTRLAATGVPVTAVVVGPGWGSLCADLRAAGVCCAWQEAVDGPEKVAELYRSLDLYWITSRIEGGPVTLLEAMASGLPCVATPVGIVPDVVRSGQNGFVVGFGEVDGFAAHTQQLWQDPDLRKRMGEAARDTIEQGWSWAQLSHSVPQLYETALRNWSARTGCPVPVDVAAAQKAYSGLVMRAPEQQLPGLPSHMRAPARAEDTLGWVRELL